MPETYQTLTSRLPELVHQLRTLAEPPLGVAVPSISAAKAAVTPPDFPVPSTKLKLEEMLVLCWSAVNEARTAATEWLSIVSSVDSLRVSTVSLQSEIEQLDVHKHAELDSSERTFLASIKTARAYAEADNVRAGNAKAYKERFYKAEAMNRVNAAVRTISLPSFRRDDVVGQAAPPYANTVDPLLTEFGPGTKVYEQAVGAQVWQEGRAADMAESQLTGQMEEAGASASATVSAVQGYTAQLEGLDTTRHAVISRVEALKVQLKAVEARLHSAEIDWNERAIGLLMRYTTATARLGGYAQALSDCLLNVYPGLLAQARLERFLALASPGQASVGAHLEEVMVFLHDAEAMLVAVQLDSIKRPLTVKVEVKVEQGKGSAAFSLGLAAFPDVRRARMRGISCLLLGPADAVYAAGIQVPEAGLRADDAADYVTQIEAGRVDLGLLRTAAAEQGDVMYGTTQCWNASPYGEWTLSVEALAGPNTDHEVQLLVSLHVEHLR